MPDRSTPRQLTHGDQPTHRGWLFLYSTALLVVCWLGMQIIHESGHILAGQLSGGTIRQVVLHPLTISRTDVLPNPFPGLVVWAGPVTGCLVPVLLPLLLPSGWRTIHRPAVFFAGFCLLANGAYLALGTFDRVGDCGVMLQVGSPVWLIQGSGSVAMVAGLLLWHRLGSVRDWLQKGRVAAVEAGLMVSAAVLLITAELVFSS